MVEPPPAHLIPRIPRLTPNQAPFPSCFPGFFMVFRCWFIAFYTPVVRKSGSTQVTSLDPSTDPIPRGVKTPKSHFSQRSDASGSRRSWHSTSDPFWPGYTQIIRFLRPQKGFFHQQTVGFHFHKSQDLFNKYRNVNLLANKTGIWTQWRQMDWGRIISTGWSAGCWPSSYTNEIFMWNHGTRKAKSISTGPKHQYIDIEILCSISMSI